MNQILKRALAGLLSIVLIATTVCVVIANNAIDTTECETYPSAYFSVTDDEGNTDGVKLENKAGSYHVVKDGDISGKVIYYCDMPLAEITMTAAAGEPTLEVSADGTAWTAAAFGDTLLDTENYHYFRISLKETDLLSTLSYKYYGTRTEREGSALASNAMATEETINNGGFYKKTTYGQGYSVYKTVDGRAVETEGEIYFKLPAVFSDFSTEITIPCTFDESGTIGFEFQKFLASKDGKSWTPVPVAYAHVGMADIGQEHCRVFSVNGTVDLAEGYRYLKVTFDPIDSTTHWIVGCDWYQIRDLSYNYDRETMEETKYEYTVAPDKSNPNFKAISEYPWRVIQEDSLDGFTDVLSFNFSPEDFSYDHYNPDIYGKYTGIFQFRSEDGNPITDVKFLGYDHRYWLAPDIRISYSSDGEVFSGVVFDVENLAGGPCVKDNNESTYQRTWTHTFNPNQNVHYLRFEITGFSTFCSFASGLTSLSYNTSKTYDYVVTPEDTSCTVISDYNYRKIAESKAEVFENVLSYNFTPAEWGSQRQWQGYEEEFKKYKGTFQFESKDGKPITDVEFNGFHINDEGISEKQVTLEYSSDGVNFRPMNCPDDPNALTYQHHYFSTRRSWKYKFYPSQNVKYLRFTINYSHPASCISGGLTSLAYNTANSYKYAVTPEDESCKVTSDYSYRKIEESHAESFENVLSYNFTPAEWGSQRQWQGYEDEFKKYKGSFRFESKDGKPITDIEFVGFYTETPNEVTLEYSSDGKNYIEIDCDNDPNALTKMYHYHTTRRSWKHSFDPELNVKYLRFVINYSHPASCISGGLTALYYNTAVSKEDADDETEQIEYLSKQNLAVTNSVTPGLVWDKVDNYIADKLDSRGYNLMAPKAAGSANKSHDNAEGEVIYRLSGILTDLSVGVVGGVTPEDAANGYMKVYVSADKANWVPLTAAPKVVKGSDLGHWDTDGRVDAAGTCRYWQYNQTFGKNDGYKYLKVVAVNGTASDPMVRQLVSVRYNTVPVTIPYIYEYEVSVGPVSTDEFTVEAPEGAMLNSPLNLNGGWGARHTYTFMKNVNGESCETTPGSVIFSTKEDKPITEWRFTGVNSTWDYCKAEFKFYASTDGENWDEYEPEIIEIGDSYMRGWEAFDFMYYGFFYPEEGYKYIKVSSTPPKTGFRLMPFYDQMSFNTEGFDGSVMPIPEKYTNRSELDNYYLKNDDTYTFQFGNAIQDVDLHTVEPISDEPQLKVTLGSGKDYLKSAIRTMVKDNGDGTAEYSYVYYYTAANNVCRMIVDLSQTEAKFKYIDYNLCTGLKDRPRRHYTDVAIDETIKDLDIPYVFDDFSKKQNGSVADQYNAGLGFVDYPNMRGGNWSYGGHVQGPDFYVTMYTPYVKDFKFRYAYHNDGSFICKEIHAYAGKDLDKMREGEETRIELVRQRVTQADVEFNIDDIMMQNWYLRPADRSVLENDDYKYIRVEVIGESSPLVDDWSALCDFKYFYELPVIEDLPEMAKPENGMFELREDFNSPMFDIEHGGKAFDYYNMAWFTGKVSGFNKNDTYIFQETYGSEAYITYNCNGIDKFDIRGYRRPDCTERLLIALSKDGTEWTEIDANYLEKAIYQGYYVYSVTGDKSLIPEGTNFLRIIIPDTVEYGDSLRISDVQLLYTNILEETEDNSDDTSDDVNTEDEEPVESIEETEPEESNEENTDDNEQTQTKPRKKYRKIVYGGFEWWVWALIIGGGVIAAAGGTLLIIFLVKKKKKKASQN